MDEAARDRLVAALRQRGVDYLAPSDAQGQPLDDAALIAALAGHADARLRQALIALYPLTFQANFRALESLWRSAGGNP